jgi:hypothetical protein
MSGKITIEQKTEDKERAMRRVQERSAKLQQERDDRDRMRLLMVEFNERQRVLMEEYVASLSEIERQAYELAKDHLTSSFQLETTHGYLKWVDQKQKTTL